MHVRHTVRPLLLVPLVAVLLLVGLAPPGGAATAAPTAPSVTGAAVAAVQVAVGFEHTCALGADAGVRCWGHDDYGQVGDGGPVGTGANAPSPRPVTGLASGVASVAAGEDHTCAVTTAGAVRCWGSNTWGMLGDGTTLDRHTPVTVAGLPAVAQVAPGGAHTCARTTAGALWCWGNDEAGELGDGTTTLSTVPRRVVGLPRPAVDVATGTHHTCAVLDDRSLWCWGWNFYGQLGAGEGRDTGTPTRVAVASVADVAARLDGTCAVTTAGATLCWGFGGYFLGDGVEDTVPTPVPSARSATAVAPGRSLSCGVLAGAVRCWGASYENTGLGDGRTLAAWAPTPVTGLASGATSLDANYGHQCAVAGGTVRCWGWNTWGQLGDGTRTDAPVPVTAPLATSTAATAPATDNGRGTTTRAWDARTTPPTSTPPRTTPRTTPRTAPATAGPTATPAATPPQVAQLAVGGSHACARTTAGALWCWGDDGSGAVGIGSFNAVPTARPVPGMQSGVTWVSTGDDHTCAVKDARLWCWGSNGHHEVSPSDDYSVRTPTLYPALTERVVQVSAGYWSTCALTVTEAVKCWGSDFSGLGDGRTTDSATPVDVAGLSSGVTSLATGRGTCAVRSGEVRCWGFNANGELGDGTRTSSPVPVRVTGLPGPATSVSQGTSTCAVVAGGSWCWGYGGSGALGTGRQQDALTPVAVRGLGSGVASLASGGAACALLSTGAVRCWGTGVAGLGNPRVYGTLVPVAVPSGVATSVAVGAGGGCLALRAGGAACWGYNIDGQVGAGSEARLSATPLPVVFTP